MFCNKPDVHATMIIENDTLVITETLNQLAISNRHSGSPKHIPRKNYTSCNKLNHRLHFYTIFYAFEMPTENETMPSTTRRLHEKTLSYNCINVHRNLQNTMR